MITPINNYQSNQSFNASYNAPKINGKFKNITPKIAEKQTKIKNFGIKVKDEFKNMDKESKSILAQVAFLFLIIATMFGRFIKAVIDLF